MKKQLVFLALSASFGVSGVQAADTGFYMGGSFGQSKISDFSGSDFDNELALSGLTSSTSTDDTDISWKAFAGYQIMKNLAVEGAYTNLGEFTARSTITAPGTGVVNTEVKAEAWTLSALGILPLGDRFSLFGRLGVNFWNADFSAVGSGSGGVASVSDSSDGTDWVYGLGATYNVAKNLNLRGEWERYDFDGTDVDLLSVGVAFKF